MSVSTPILMTLSDICACAPVMDSAAATAAATIVSCFVFMLPPVMGTALSLHAEIVMQLVHVRIELGIGNHVGDAAVLDDVMTVRHGSGEPEILFDQQDGKALLLEAPD